MKTLKDELGRYPAILTLGLVKNANFLTSRLVNNTYVVIR